MATDPSVDYNHKSHKHARTLTPITPVLPLSLSDKKWTRTSQAATQVTDSQEQLSAVQHGRDLDFSTSGSVETVKEAPKEEQEVVDDTSNVSPDVPAINGEVEQQSSHETLAEPSAVNNEILTQPLQDPSSELKSRDASIATEASSSRSQATDEVTKDSAQVPAPTEHQVVSLEHTPEASRDQVRLSEEETQTSEHEASSRHHSSTTGLTDYDSTAGESTLETVTHNVYHPQKHAAGPHHQSEMAPEVLTNGFSPSSANGSHVSHTVNGSIDISLQSRPEPPLPNIQDHLLFLISTKQACDIAVQVNQPDRSYDPFSTYAHSVFLLRSPKLAKLMAEYDPALQTKVINLYPARNVLPHAFEAALRFFYSDSILTPQTLMPQGLFQDKHAKAQVLEYIMSYWLSGVELGLVPVKTRSYEMMNELIDWDTAELVAKEIHDLRAAELDMSTGPDNFEVKDISDILTRLLARLFARRLNVSHFSLDKHAQATVLPTRFTQLEFNRSSNPALSGMVFGSLASQAAPSPSPTSIASTILLNIDYTELTSIGAELIAVHGVEGEAVLRNVVDQREDKRTHVISNRALSNKQRLSESAIWEAAGWKEQVNDHGQLTRERVGYLLPTRGR